jgi:hypothetical protein
LILLLMLYLLRKSVKRSLSAQPVRNHAPAWLTLAHAPTDDSSSHRKSAASFLKPEIATIAASVYEPVSGVSAGIHTREPARQTWLQSPLPAPWHHSPRVKDAVFVPDQIHSKTHRRSHRLIPVRQDEADELSG